MTARSVVTVRLSDSERAILERHGRPLADQLRRDLRLVEALERAEGQAKGRALSLRELRSLIQIED